MSTVRTNVEPNDLPALVGLLVRKYVPGGTVVFSEEELDAQPAAFSFWLGVNDETGLLELKYFNTEEFNNVE